MKWARTQLSDFLRERGERIEHEKANRLGLQRIRKIDFDGNVHLSESTATKTDMIRVRCGDLVISGIGAAQGAIAVYEGAPDVLATIHYSAYQFDRDRISAEFLKWFLKSAQFSETLKKQASRRIRVEIKAKHLLPLQVKMPNLPGQHKIAERMNAVDAEHSKLEHEIARQDALIAKLKQSILQEAIQGKLTADWRAKNPDVEPASRLLHRIKGERDRLTAEKKIRKQKPLSAIIPEEIPFQIPERWEWCRLGLLGAVNPRNKVADEKEVSFVPMSAIPVEYMGEIKADKRPWREIKTGYTHIANGVVASAKITPCFENGKAAAFRNLTGSVGAATTELHVLHPFLAHADYLLIFLKSPFYIHTGIPKMTGTAGQKRVPLDYFTNALVPIPPPAEQTAIVKKVDSMMKICHDLEAEIERSRTEARALTQAALKEAFISHDTEDSSK